MIADGEVTTKTAAPGREARELALACRLVSMALDVALETAPPAMADEEDGEVSTRLLRRRAHAHLSEAAELVDRASRLLDPAEAKAALEEVAGKYAPITAETLEGAYIGSDPESPKSRGLVAVLTNTPPGGGPAKVIDGQSFKRRVDAERWLNYQRLEHGLPPLADVPRGTVAQ